MSERDEELNSDETNAHKNTDETEAHENSDENEANENSDQTSKKKTTEGTPVSFIREILTCYNVALLIAIYVISMMLIALAVYGSYGWKGKGSGPNSTLGSVTSGMIETVIDQIKGQNQSLEFQPIALNLTGICPINGVCPSFNNCTETSECLPQPKPQCTPQVWPARRICKEPVRPCPAGSCPFPECPATTVPHISLFRGTLYQTTDLLDMFNYYPPHSANRLEVVTTLLQKTVEQFAFIGHFHRCESHPNYPFYETICSFCKDRYQYVRCIMSNELVSYLEPNTDKVIMPIYWETELATIHRGLVEVMYKTWHPNHFDHIFQRIENMLKTFAFRTANGGRCQVCTDFSRSVYERCYSDPKKWYNRPEYRQLENTE